MKAENQCAQQKTGLVIKIININCPSTTNLYRIIGESIVSLNCREYFSIT